MESLVTLKIISLSLRPKPNHLLSPIGCSVPTKPHSCYLSIRAQQFGFRLIVFRPFVGEIIAAKLKESDANGLRCTVSNNVLCLLLKVKAETKDTEIALKVKEWELRMFQDELAASQGIRIRRRPPTAPPLHYVGPFELQKQNEDNTPRNTLEDNTPRNTLEEIIWQKDVEVSQLKERRPLAMLKKDLESAPPARDFIGALRVAHLRTGLPGLIAEVKKASPSRMPIT